jgi:DNA polymerase-3 subunit epsilon
MNILFFDVESTGLPRKDPDTGETHQPNITQLGLILERHGVDVMTVDALIKPDNWFVHEDPTGELPPSVISHRAMEVTGITPEMCEEQGIPIADAVELFIIAAEHADLIVCHNTAFDTRVIEAEYGRCLPKQKRNTEQVFSGSPALCTMKTATPICKIPKKGVVRPGGSNWKWPKLEEAVPFFFGVEMENAHSAIVDISWTRKVFHKLVEIGAFDKEVYRLERAGKITPALYEEFMQLAEAA